ncbi:MAG: hypothetical protein IIZ35_01045, partial [Clostridia bacterium]|nr:hypothetical protein [Clostridia bacterium]
MKDNEIEVRLSDMFAILLKAFKPILCITLVFALLGAGFGLYKGLNAEKNPTVTQDDLKAAEAEVKSAEIKVRNAEKALTKRLEREIPDAERKIERAEQLIQRRKEYIDNSLYYALNPFHCGVSRLSFYIETDSELNPSAPWLNADPQASIVNAYTRIFSVDTEILDEIRNIMHTDVAAQYIKEVVSVANVSNQFVEIRVYHEDAKVAESVVNYLYETLLDRLKGSVGDFSANVISRFTGYEVDWGMNDNHIASEDNLLSAERSLSDAEDNLEKLNNEIPDLEQSIADNKDALVEAQNNLETVQKKLEESAVNPKNVIKKTFKYAILLLIVGLAIACCAALVLSLAGSKLQNQSFVLSRFSFPLLGVLPRRKKRPFEKTIRRLEGDPETYFESAARVAAQNLLAVAADRKVCLVSSLGAKEAEPLVPYLNDRVAICGDILRDVVAVKSL